MPSIRKSLLQFIFAGAFMKRWNDKLRPMELLEVDKQAHKMIAAWALYRMAAADLPREEALDLGERIVEGGLFDYFYRLVITDIKPPIFYQMKANPEHYRKLTEWVLEQLEPRVVPLGQDFWQRLQIYLLQHEDAEPAQSDPARRILNAAHLYASYWEFNLIKGLSPLDDEIQEIDASFQDGLGALTDIRGVDQLLAGHTSPLGKFLHLCGQLRFQKRWSQTPRVPETSVLGHMYIVACYGYCMSMAVGACRARRVNNFFSGLFHDLPELLTRDIISPVKKSVRHIAELIEQYEKQELQRRVLQPLGKAGLGELVEGLRFHLGLEVGGEFVPSALDPETGQRRAVSEVELFQLCNEDHHDAKDGQLLKVCDTLAAYIEAYTALRNGISSDQLQEGLWRMRSGYQNLTLGQDLHIGALLADFD
ncbi:HD domain-containing protein [Megalodesulfovibrio paquesii]